MKLTTTQIAARLGISERTVQRWISNGRLPAYHITRNQYQIEEADLDRLTRRTDSDYEISLLRRQVEILEQRISLLETIVKEAATFSNLDTQQVNENQLAESIFKYNTANVSLIRPKEVPTTVGNFAKLHDLTMKQLQSLLKQNVFSTTKPASRGRGGLASKVLAPEQQAAIIAYLQTNNIPYKQCQDCPHNKI